jgi:hypothetical protein
MEKGRGENNVNEVAIENGHAHITAMDPRSSLDIKDGRLLEASEVYGDIETAQKYGYVARGYVQLNTRPRCISMLSMAALVSSPDTSNSLPLEVLLGLACS